MPRHAVIAFLMGVLQVWSMIGIASARAESAPKGDPVVRALRQSEADKAPSVLNQACDLLRRAEDSREASVAERQRLLAEIAGKLRDEQPAMLQARGDAARLGLYGLPKNLKQAERFYTLAAERQSAESGYNAALLLYLNSRQKPNQATAKHILNVLQKSTITHYNVKGIVAAQAHFLAAQIHEQGLAGRKDPGKAFLHYRVSARNGYVPGIYRYLRMLSGSVAKLPEDERMPHVQEMRAMASRWKWASPDIMRLMGDLHAAGWVADKDGFYAQYHWRLAARMGGNPGASVRPPDAIQALPDPALERRLNSAVEAALKQNKARPRTYKLEFADVCS
ncbi:sel1 repeat family protein [Allochromatium humboldtianum]|uniref:Sel1 repeat family protein n=1 Tax=Allochromatium humboldtianum TaxID=504901 RepID=A0A850RBV9_9GAMM|nr:sel1 repeat family protein [Allochromatium humboldtianum]NVZ11504.1 sel1 repeat family protein [Allochromatium humboldtianum]